MLPSNQHSPLLAGLIRRLGEAGALALCEHWGGIPLYVPHKLPAGHVLLEKLGREAATKLVSHHAGELLMVPNGKHYLRSVRDARMKARAAAGASAAAIAREEGLHLRQVRRVLAGETTAVSPQAQLFT